MNLSKQVGFVVGVMGIAMTACAVETPGEVGEGNAPEAALDSLDQQDEGTSYNGWTQTADALYWPCHSQYLLDHSLARTSGDATRGGGGCLVLKTTTSCSSDSTCTTAAQSQYGSSAYGYCYAGKCYHRAGSQTNLCTVPNGNRTPGLMRKYLTANDFAFGDHALGCMTKTAGPNTACGGTNTSLYMRTVKQATYPTICP